MRRNTAWKLSLDVFVTVMLVSVLALGGCGQALQNTAGTDVQDSVQSVEAAVQISESYELAKVSYLGPKGTYTQEACERFFGGAGEYLPCETVPDAVQRLVDGQSDYAVIPLENSIGGPVVDYVDTLLDQKDVYVVGEVELPISQNLLVLPGTTLEDIAKVYSHKQGITQGKAWLEQNLPNAEVSEVSSTAEGARMVSEGGDASCAAIASAGCADVYGLEILAPGIQMNDSNKTRFYVLSLKEPGGEPGDRTAFVATGKATALPALLAAIEGQGMELVALHDRPQKTELGSYRYLVECSGGSAKSFEGLSHVEGFEYRYLGSFRMGLGE